MELIDRQAAIDALYHVDEYNGRSVEAIRNLPSAQPETHEKRTETHACDCISRQEALVAVKDALLAWSSMPEWRDDKILEAIAELPPAQPKKGKWILDGHHVRCDKCGMYMCNTNREGDPIPSFFCPNCGAEMREVTE